MVVTSHSADLLDNVAIRASSILAVLSEHAETRIGPLDDAGRSVLREHLFTAGELLRMDQLHPDPEQAAPRQISLFASGARWPSCYNSSGRAKSRTDTMRRCGELP